MSSSNQHTPGTPRPISVPPLGGALTRRNLLALAGGVGLTSVIAACGGTSTPSSAGPATSGSGGTAYTGPKVTLSFWNGFTGGDGPYIQRIVDEFNKKNPNIVVRMNVYQWADFFQKLPAAVASGNGPNVAAMHLSDIPTYAAQQIIVPVDDVAAALHLTQSDFSPIVWQGGIYQGKRYGIPLDVHPLGLYYNKTVLQKAGLDPETPPQTKDAFMAALAKLKAKGVQGYWMSPFPFTGGLTFFSLLYQYGGGVLASDNTTAVFNSAAGVQALTWMRSMVTSGYSPANVAQDADYVAFKNNRTAFNINGIWQVNDLATTPGLKWGVAPVPRIGAQTAVWSDSHQFVVPRQRANDPNLAAASRYFINYITKNSLTWVESGKVPASKVVLDSAGFKKLTNLQPFAAELPYVHFPVLLPGGGDVLTQMYNGVQAAMLGKASPASALNSAARLATKVAQNNRKQYGA